MKDVNIWQKFYVWLKCRKIAKVYIGIAVGISEFYEVFYLDIERISMHYAYLT